MDVERQPPVNFSTFRSVVAICTTTSTTTEHAEESDYTLQINKRQQPPARVCTRRHVSGPKIILIEFFANASPLCWLKATMASCQESLNNHFMLLLLLLLLAT